VAGVGRDLQVGGAPSAAAVEATHRGTSDGTLALPGGELRPTGRAVNIEPCRVFEAATTASSSTTGSYFDVAGFLQRLGIGG